ncbi:MAG: hypothetical protein GY828_00005, partial [Candidatus Gracilibacteria bacterium]|nr:hypothetical protein [Candidatus Gracilibacteria bacterium]
KNVSYPLDIDIYNDSEKGVVSLKDVQKNKFDPYYKIPALKESGLYTLIITDAEGYEVKKTFEIMPGKPDQLKIDLGANMLQNKGAVSSNVVTILDSFDNPVIGTTYTFDMEIVGNGIVFQSNNSQELSSEVIEGYKVFRLMTQDSVGKNSLNISLKNLEGETLLTESAEINVLGDVSVDIIKNDNLMVGGNTYRIRAEVKDAEGKINNEINSRLYFNINDIYGETTAAYFPVIDGVAHIEIETASLASPDIPVEIQIEGMSEIFNDTISILHSEPRYLQLAMAKSSMQAEEGNIQELKIFIKDRFGNVAYTFNKETFDMEVTEKFSKYIRPLSDSANITQGVGTIDIEATDTPGLAHFKITVDDLVTAGQLETFYYWNEKTVQDMNYNALYTTLIGAPYGDYTKTGYLAGGLLFDKNNRSLAVTSLLNNPYKQNDVVMIHTEGGIESLASGSDLSVDISFEPFIENKKLQINMSNLALGGYIGKLVPHFGKQEAQLSLCAGNNGDISECGFDSDKTSIGLQSQSSDFNAYKKDNNLYIQDKFGKTLFSIDEFGSIERFGNISFELSRNNTQKHLQLEIF